MMKMLSFGILVLLFILPVGAQEAVKPGPEAKNAEAASPTSDEVYYIQIRVIFAGTTGIFGNLPRELHDMQTLLTQSFRYPSFELSNSIRVSLFGDEEAVALVFPDHYIRIIPKGATRSGEGLKVKSEIYEIAVEKESEEFVTQGDLNLAGIKEENQEGSHSKVFPLVSSAMVLRVQEWEAVGGVPVRVNTQGQVRSRSLSTSPMSRTSNPALGEQKYLILGMKLEKID